MYEVKISYTIKLTYTTLEDAEKAAEMLFAGGLDEVTIKYVPIEEVA